MSRLAEVVGSMWPLQSSHPRSREAFLLVLAVVGEGERQVIIILGSQDVGVTAKRRRQPFKTRELKTLPQTVRGLSPRRCPQVEDGTC